MKTSIAHAGLLLALATLFCLPTSTMFATETNSAIHSATSQRRAGTPVEPAGEDACATTAANTFGVVYSGAATAPPQLTIAAEAPTAVTSAPAIVPYGVDDVLKLSRAQIGEDIILNYVQNSGTIYNFGFRFGGGWGHHGGHGFNGGHHGHHR